MRFASRLIQRPLLQFIPAIAVALLTLSPLPACSQSLQLAFGNKGLKSVSYNGIVLEDTGINPGDVFHIWHMKATDLSGNAVAGAQDGWGENNNGESWDASSKTETYNFNWGSIAVQFIQSGTTLNIVVTETNSPGSGILFDGAAIYPLALHFPKDPLGFNSYSQYAITTLEPGISTADFGSGLVTSVIPDESQPLYGGWQAISPNVYSPIMTSTAPDSLPLFLPHNDRPVAPGTSFAYTVSLRFSPEGAAVQAADAYASFARKYPSRMTWTDKRIIGTVYLASSPDGSAGINQSGGFPTNPRRYFNDPSVDVTTAAGLKAFQTRILAEAASEVVNARALNSQGIITWDLEGEQFPQNTSYVCSPDQIAAVAPEMESLITENSGFLGKKLDDAYFQILSRAGLRTGVCLRPQVFDLAKNGTASQNFLSSNTAIIANLENKARVANARWGTTLFYVDSTVYTDGGTLDPAIFEQLITDLPSFLFIPEESTPRYYAYTAPFYSFIFHGDLGTPSSTYLFYPKAFGANLVNDVAASTLASASPQLIQSVKDGDILMGHADYWQANNPTLVSIYAAAGVTNDPNLVTPAISWSAPADVASGKPLSAAQLNASTSTPGTFTYSPSIGTILPVGKHTLLATFTPSESNDYRSATANVTINITAATSK